VPLPGLTRQSDLSADTFWITGSRPAMTLRESRGNRLDIQPSAFLQLLFHTSGIGGNSGSEFWTRVAKTQKRHSNIRISANRLVQLGIQGVGPLPEI
jgi:hypothetical protein